MKFGISTLSIVPVRKDPAETSEMVTQVLFGETYEILKENRKWQYIRLSHDKYEGWIDLRMSTTLDKRHYNLFNTNEPFITSDICSTIISAQAPPVTIVAGSSIHGYHGKKVFRMHRNKYKVVRSFSIPETMDIRKKVMKFSVKYINSPYLWGGRSPFGIDCSGFTQIVYRIAGIHIPRDAKQQVLLGVAVDFVNEAHPGDLAFFDDNDGNIIHTGIILDNSRIIHASGMVRIDNIDHEGINHAQNRRYTHRLRVVKNIIDHI